MKKDVLIIIFLCVAVFVAHLAHPLILGTDSYFFLGAIKEGNEDLLFDSTPALSKAALMQLPFDIFAVKYLLLAVMVVCCLIMVLWGTLYNKDNAFFLGILVFCSPLWILNFVKLEDDIFAFPFLLLSNLFLIKGNIENNFKYKLLSLGLILFSLMFWRGSLMYLPAWALSFWPALIGGGVLAFYFNKLEAFYSAIFYHMNRNLEATPFTGLTYIFWGWIGVLGQKKEFVLQTIYWIILGTISLKWMVHALPFLALGAFIYLNKLDSYKQNLFKGICIALTIGLCISFVLIQPPTTTQIQAVDYAIEKSNETGLTLKNQYDLGHLIRFKGGTPYYAFTPPDFPDYNNSIAITNEVLECTILKKFPELLNETFVYHCE